MVGVEDRRFQCLHRFDGLVDGHRVGLVDRQEGDVDILQRLQFGRGFAIAGDVDARAAEGEDIAAVLAVFGMELQVPVGRVVSGHGLDFQVIARRGDAARTHRVAVHFERFGRGAVAEDFGLRRLDRFDGRHVQVVVVRVGDEHHVGLGQGGVVGIAAYGIYVDVFSPGLDRERGVFEKGERDLRAVARSQRVGRVFGSFLSASEKR